MTIYPNGGALKVADLVRTGLAGAEVHLYKDISPPLSAGTILTDLTEADYAGYNAMTITAWLASYIDPQGGASFQSGTQQFDFQSTPGTGNVIQGFYVLNGGGDLIAVGSFDSPIAMANPGDSIPVDIILNYCRPQ